MENHYKWVDLRRAWLGQVIQRVGLKYCGTPPDFGNFCIRRGVDASGQRVCIEEHDRFQGVAELMPFAKPVFNKRPNSNPPAHHMEIVLVTPVWNDSNRLARFGPELAEKLSEHGANWNWVIADDGSNVTEATQLRRLVEQLQSRFPKITLIRLGKRSRKGGAIYTAWNAFPNADILAFADADGAVAAEDILRLVQLCADQHLHRELAVIGVRRNSIETPVQRSLYRSFATICMRRVIWHLLNVPWLDTQCGIKAITGKTYRSLCGSLLERGFAFDIELLLALRQNGVCIIEVPVPWKAQGKGKVHPLVDAASILAALWRIRKRAKHSGYGNVP